ncbi:MAG: chorismate synthase [Bdellovibrionales bacterium]|nr:chorismate synthase [Bdellovibrionales bacterium]
MSANSLGKIFKLHSFGESHGIAMGVVLEGCPAGLTVSKKVLQSELDRRRPGAKAWDSSRNELDQIQIISGVFKGKTLGTPIAVLVFNKNSNPKSYEFIKKSPRPGHSEDLWKFKFSHYDHRGGGRSSGRETLGRVIAGAFAKMMIKKLCPDLKILAFVKQIGDIKLLDEETQIAENLLKKSQNVDSFLARFPHKKKSQDVFDLLMKAKKEGESLGALTELWIENIPKALGQPLFHKFKSDLAQAIMSLGASCSFEVGLGKDSASQKGSHFHKTKTNYGGIRGGLTTGEKIIIKTTFKPPSSYGTIAKKGRFDPCIGPRVIPVLEAIAYFITVDHLLLRRLDRL